ncbi:SUMF1/EgtB/PvdO family nonheme iron enzyme [Desulfoluna sp.]|uniref:SUMF1/EgtB/PvdO family nonheme iron enzyme n=1 Tax=Desulfoluna sp. TaxID=2045199 RepID=UPI002622D251|nr:SUMF1/EgtB/PvdO family nonheme iron enzyme [Desulfoluna sp.]
MLDKMKGIIEKCLPTYEIVGELGQGIHGSVYHAKDRLKERAVKVVPIHVERSTLFRNDVDLDSKVSRDFHAVCSYYEKVKGPDVVTVHDFHLVDKRISSGYAQAFLVILMELCRENLQELVLREHPLAADTLLSYALDLASMMDRLSQASGEAFLLTDFKPSNILVGEQGQLLMGDLGGLKRVSSVSSVMAGAQFTPNWSAPELILRGEKPDVISGVYSLGLVVYYLCEGHLPFEEVDFIDRVRKVQETGVVFSRDDLPVSIIQAVVSCLSYDREDRPGTFAEVKELLNGGAVERTQPASSPVSAPEIKPAPSRTKATMPSVWVDQATGLTMNWVDGGTLTLRRSEHLWSDEISGCYMGIHPVTQAQWRKLMGTNPSHFPKIPDQPVEMVSWKDADAFCRRLTEIYKGTRRFFIPSEGEWLYAALGGDEEALYAGGDNLDTLGWHLGNSDFSTHPVAEKNPNAHGLYDMCGNVQEWCCELMTCFDGRGMETREKVIRGGSWNQSPEKCTLESRRIVQEGLRYSNLGFRIAMRA